MMGAGSILRIADCELRIPVDAKRHRQPIYNPQFAIRNPQSRGLGLTGSAERVRMLGGKQTIQTSPGQGTTIHIIINTDKHAGKQ